MLYATNISTVFQFCKEGNYETAWKMVFGRYAYPLTTRPTNLRNRPPSQPQLTAPYRPTAATASISGFGSPGLPCSTLSSPWPTCSTLCSSRTSLSGPCRGTFTLGHLSEFVPSQLPRQVRRQVRRHVRFVGREYVRTLFGQGELRNLITATLVSRVGLDALHARYLYVDSLIHPVGQTGRGMLS